MLLSMVQTYKNRLEPGLDCVVGVPAIQNPTSLLFGSPLGRMWPSIILLQDDTVSQFSMTFGSD